jgi:hypothetical protein
MDVENLDALQSAADQRATRHVGEDDAIRTATPETVDDDATRRDIVDAGAAQAHVASFLDGETGRAHAAAWVVIIASLMDARMKVIGRCRHGSGGYSAERDDSGNSCLGEKIGHGVSPSNPCCGSLQSRYWSRTLGLEPR